MKMGDVLTRVEGKPISVKDVVDHLKVTGAFRNTIYQLIEKEVIALQCRQRGVTVDEGAFDAYLVQKRRVSGLVDALTVNNYCRWNGVQWEQWKDLVRHEFMRQKLKEQVVDDASVRGHFEATKESLKMVRVARIVMNDAADAQALLGQLREHPEAFGRLARELSQDHNGRASGGMLGSFRRGMLPAPLEEQLFSAAVGAVLGPIHEGHYWTLYKVEEMLLPELTETLYNQLAEKLFSEWLRGEVLRARP